MRQPTGGSGAGLTSRARPAEWPGPLATGLLIAVFFGLLAAMFVREEQRRLSDPVLKAQRGEITVTSPESLLREPKVTQALRLIERAAPAGSVVEGLRLSPTRINATIVHPDGRRFAATIDPAMELSQVRAGAMRPSGPTAGEIDPAVPSRLVARAESRLNLQRKDLEYVVLSTGGAGSDPTWGLFYAEPPLDNHAVAAFDGSQLRLAGQPSAPASDAEIERLEREALKEAGQ